MVTPNRLERTYDTPPQVVDAPNGPETVGFPVGWRAVLKLADVEDERRAELCVQITSGDDPEAMQGLVDVGNPSAGPARKKGHALESRETRVFRYAP